MRAFVFVVTTIALLCGIFVAVLLWAPRPEDTTDPAIFAEDGASIDYCAIPELSSGGLKPSDIPKAYTPACGWKTFPMPILAGCTEPLSPGAPDLRGLWLGYEGAVGHVERIEQCGDRVVITSSAIIHDMRADGTLTRGANDINPNGCFRIWAAATYVDNALVLRPFGQSLVTVTRNLEDDELVWSYPSRGVTRMRRICRLPA